MVHVSPCTWGLLFCSLFRIVRTVHPSATEPSGKSHLLLCDVLSAHQINPHGFSLSPHWSNLFSLLLTYYAVYDFPSFVACTWMKSPCQSFCTLCPLNHCSHLIYHFEIVRNGNHVQCIKMFLKTFQYSFQHNGPLSIHFLHPLNPIQGHRGLEPIPAPNGRQAGYTLDRLLIHNVWKWKKCMNTNKYLPAISTVCHTLIHYHPNQLYQLSAGRISLFSS